MINWFVAQVWATYSPVKNSAKAAVEKASSGVPPHAAFSGEADIYQCCCKTLSSLGTSIGDARPRELFGLTVPVFPCVVWSPSFAITFADLKVRVGYFPASEWNPWNWLDIIYPSANLHFVVQYHQILFGSGHRLG